MRYRGTLEDFGPSVSAVVPPRVMDKIGAGRVRVPVQVTINGFTFRTTTFRMGDEHVRIALNKQNVAGARASVGKSVTIDIEPDAAPRTVEVPRELAAALRKQKRLTSTWDAMSYTHRKEWAQAIEEAKRPETRARRVDQCLEALRARAK